MALERMLKFPEMNWYREADEEKEAAVDLLGRQSSL